MGQQFNQAGNFVPVRERREVSGVLAALNAELVLDVNGDESAMIAVNGSSSTLNCTLSFQGSVDGVNYFPILVVPYYAIISPPAYMQPLISESFSAAIIQRVYALKCGQLKKVRVLMTAWAQGNASIVMVSDANKSIHPVLFDAKPATLLVTATGAAGAAVTATLPAVTGMRHYVDSISVTKFATAALTAAATPVLVTTTNLPGPPVLNFPADAAAQGTDVLREMDFMGSGLVASSAGAATTVVAPATTGVIWRVQVAYRLGL